MGGMVAREPAPPQRWEVATAGQQFRQPPCAPVQDAPHLRGDRRGAALPRWLMAASLPIPDEIR